MDDIMILYDSPYTVAGHLPMQVTDKECGLDMTCTLFYKAVIRMLPADGNAEARSTLPESIMEGIVSDAVLMGYDMEYPDGMTAEELLRGKPEEAFAEKIRGPLNGRLSAFYGVTAAEFTVAEHWVPVQERNELESVLKAKETLSDPKAAAEALLAELQAKIGEKNAPQTPEAPAAPAFRPEDTKKKWVCACGRINDTRFCPDCGRPASDSYHRKA